MIKKSALIDAVSVTPVQDVYMFFLISQEVLRASHLQSHIGRRWGIRMQSEQQTREWQY